MSNTWIGRSSRRRIVTLACTAALATTALAACGSSEESEASALKIGISPISIYAAGYEMGDCVEEKGYSLDLPEFAATPDRLAALVNGSIDLAFGGFTDTIKLDSQGAPLVAVSNAATGGYQLVASADSGIASIEDLEGKTIAVPKGTIQELTLRYAMQEVGLDSSEDAELLQMDYANMPVALERGDIDAFVGTAPYPAISVAEGETEIPWPADLPWGQLNSGVVTTTDFAEKHPEAVRAVTDCLTESTTELKSDPAALEQLYVTKYKVPEDAVDVLMNHFTLTTDVDPAQVQGLIDAEYSLGYIEEKPAVDDVLKVAQ